MKSHESACPVLVLTHAWHMWIQVIREGGINPIVDNDRSQAQSASTDVQSANDHAVGDAMECLVHIVRASQEGHAVTLQSRGLSAAAQALQVSSSAFSDLSNLLYRCS